MKLPYISAILMISLMCFLACKKSKTDDKGKDLILSSEEQSKVIEDNKFAFRLLKEVAAEEDANKNIMISPFSVGMALSMTANGANAATLTAMRKTLNSESFSGELINGYYSKTIRDLPLLDPTTNINIANSIWYRQGFTPIPAFLQTNSDAFKARIEALNFQDPSAKNVINDWVNAQTKGKIPKIVEDISNDMVMYLINAVYFKGAWKYTFDKSKTTTAAFHLDNGQTVPVSFMSDKIKLNAAIRPSESAYELMYGNGKYSMVIVVPAANTSLNDYISSMNAEKWTALTSAMHESENIIQFPKFKFAYDIKLNPALKNLGMGVAFSDQADFTRINAQGQLSITEVKHKTFIDVNEEGTEAAAATSVGIALTSLPQQFIVNRPFLFAIVEKSSGLILFNGLIRNPSE